MNTAARDSSSRGTKWVIEYCREMLAFLDGSSRGTRGGIEYCREVGKRVTVIEKS